MKCGFNSRSWPLNRFWNMKLWTSLTKQKKKKEKNLSKCSVEESKPYRFVTTWVSNDDINCICLLFSPQ